VITIDTSKGGIFLKTLERSRLDTVAELYNCSRDIRYATGIAGPVSSMDLDERLFKLNASENEFMIGIYKYNLNKTSIKHELQLAGLISGYLQGKTIWIKIIAILPKYRRLGIGSKSAELLLHYFKAIYGTVEAYLSVIEDNSTGMLFWLNQGFSEAARISKELFDFEQPYKVIIMYRKL